MRYSNGYLVLRPNEIVSMLKNESKYTRLLYLFSLIENLLTDEEKEGITSLPLEEDMMFESLEGIEEDIVTSTSMAGSIDVLCAVEGYVIHGICWVDDYIYKTIIPSTAFPLTTRMIVGDVQFL